MHDLGSRRRSLPLPAPPGAAAAHAPEAEVFPEWEFTPTPEREAEYRRACQIGTARMARSRVVIAAVCRDVEWILPATIRRIDSLMSRFAAARVVLYENDSRDASKTLLRRWAASDTRVLAITENLDAPVNPAKRCAHRAARMARYRTTCQRAILARHGDYDAVIVLDMDLVGGWSEEGIAHTFGQDDWDFIGANGLIFRRSGFDVNQFRQYDTWAYRHRGSDAPLASAETARLVPRRGAPLIPVGSCFGGLGIYSMAAFGAGSYAGSDCEHVNFHHSLARQGFHRLFLNPSLITLYGRRHRSTDGFVVRLLSTWSSLTGARAAPWRYPDRSGTTLQPGPADAVRPRKRAAG